MMADRFFTLDANIRLLKFNGEGNSIDIPAAFYRRVREKQDARQSREASKSSSFFTSQRKHFYRGRILSKALLIASIVGLAAYPGAVPFQLAKNKWKKEEGETRLGQNNQRMWMKKGRMYYFIITSFINSSTAFHCRTVAFTVSFARAASWPATVRIYVYAVIKV